MLRIWQAKNPVSVLVTNKEPLVFPDDFTPVALCDTDDPEDAWAMTNTLGVPEWWEREDPKVKPIQVPARSTSVGDLAEEDDGLLHVYMPQGAVTLPRGTNRIPVNPLST